MHTTQSMQPSVDLSKCETTKDFALTFARAGIPVIPLYSAMTGVCTCGNTECSSPAKHPRTAHGCKDASVSPDVVKRWFSRDGNLGVVTGCGIVVLDVDADRDGHDSLYELEERHGPLTPTLTVLTGGGGMHYYYYIDVPAGCSVDKLGRGLDVRGDGGYVVGPGSTHVSGVEYTVDVGQPSGIASAPEWFAQLVKKKRVKTNEEGTAADAVIEGGRNTHLTSMAGSMRRKGFSEEAIITALLIENKEKCNPGLDEVEVKQIAKSVARYQPEAHDWRALLKTNKEGAVTRDPGNAAILLCNLPEWKGALEYDEFKDVIRWSRDAPKGIAQPLKGEELLDHHITHTQHWLSLRTGASFTGEATIAGIAVAAHEHVVHPVREYLSRIKWDGVARLPTWLHTYLGADDCTLYRNIGTWWMVGAVARIIKPGTQVDHMLVLEGPQGMGKSTAARILGGEWHLGSLPDLRNAQTASMLIQGYWIVEAGELDAFKQAGSSRIKDFLTQVIDVYRRPYARSFQRRPRQCSLIGTTNESAYLSDPTGNRRYWPCRVREVDPVALRRDRDLLWAEAVARYESGEPWHPTGKIVLELADLQEESTSHDVWEDRISRYLLKRGEPFVTAEELLIDIGLELAKVERRHQQRIGTCMTRLGWKPGRATRANRRRRGFIAPQNWISLACDSNDN